MDAKLQETRVGDVMTTSVMTISTDETITKAADKMLKSKIHGLVTVNGSVPVGVITTFDLLKIAFLKEYSDSASVSKYSSKRDLITIEIDAPLSEAAFLMVENNIRTIPVVEAGQLVGIISMIDILKCVIE